MQLTQLVANDTLLTYALSTAPSPLQVSPQSGPPSVAALTFVISCPVSVGSVTVTQIAFNLPVGDPSAPESTDLTEVGTGITPSVSSADWQIAPGTATGSFVLTPASGNSGIISSQGLTVTLVGIQVGPIVGTALINIVEDATDGSGPAQPLLTSIAVAKFPYGVVVGDFAASAPMIQNGATVTLSWIGSVGPAYTLLWAQQSQNVTSVNQWTSPDLTDTTTFILSVVAQESGQTVSIQFSVTVIVADPDITATTLDVLQASTLTGDVTASGNLMVGGTATAGTVNAGTLGVTGSSTLASLAVSGAATAGSLQTASLNASAATLGATTITGLSALGGAVSMIGYPQSIQPGMNPNWNVYTAPTDGFAVGWVYWPAGDNVSAGCMAIAFGFANGMQVSATGGNVGFFGPGWSDCMWSNANTFVLPVAANSQFQVMLQQMGGSGQQANAQYAFWWIPIGSGQVTATFVGTKKAEAQHAPKNYHVQHRPDEARWKFIATLERVVGRQIDPVTKQQLISELRQF